MENINQNTQVPVTSNQTNQPVPPVPPINSNQTNNSRLVILYIIIVVLLLGMGFLGYEVFTLKKSPPTPTENVSNIQSTTSPPTLDPTANWKTYQVLNGGDNFSEGIEYKMPTEVNPPKWVNAGHYYQALTLPGNTELGIFMIGQGQGFSPSYDQFVNNEITKHNLTQTPIKVGGKDAILFSGKIQDPIYSQDLLILGEGVNNFTGVITKINDNKSLYLLHYDEKFITGTKDFTADEKLFNQILSTFKFVTATQPTNIPITKTQSQENTYTDPVFKTMIDVPQGWKVTTGKDRVDMYYFKITKTTAEKSPLSGSLVPEIYIGTDSYYTATGVICSLEDCPIISSFDPRSSGQRYNYATKANIIKRSQNGKQDFYSLTFLYGDNLMNPPISANYITEDQKQEILKIESTFRFQGTD